MSNKKTHGVQLARNRKRHEAILMVTEGVVKQMRYYCQRVLSNLFYKDKSSKAVHIIDKAIFCTSMNIAKRR